MDARTGKHLQGDAHLRQSIADILTTPLGTRVMRRDYGSLLPELLDQPFNGATRVRVYGATAGALMRWEPRLQLTRVQINPASEAGSFALEIEARHRDRPRHASRVQLSIPLRIH